MTSTTNPPRAEYLRFPKNGQRCPVTGLTRPFLYNLATLGEIKTVSLRHRGKSRGVRLIIADTLIGYINSRVEEVAAK